MMAYLSQKNGKSSARAEISELEKRAKEAERDYKVGKTKVLYSFEDLLT